MEEKDDFDSVGVAFRHSEYYPSIQIFTSSLTYDTDCYAVYACS